MRPAIGVTPPRWQEGRQLGCRAKAGQHQLQREVERSRCAARSAFLNGSVRIAMPVRRM
jgi:hypothetical protein